MYAYADKVVTTKIEEDLLAVINELAAKLKDTEFLRNDNKKV